MISGRNSIFKLVASLIIFTGGAASIFSQEYDFDIPEEEYKIEFNGNLDAKWGLLRSNSDSPIYGLQFFDDPEKQDYLSQYRLDFYLNGEYRHKEVGFTLKTYYQYVKEDPLPPSIFELYGSLNISPKMTVGIGKRRFNWGKAYAFNPVGYVNAAKDPENPDLALAGKPSAFLNFNKSFSDKALQNLSFSAVALAPDAEFADKFAAADDINFAAKFYLLYRNIDIDFMTYQAKNQPTRYGFDFAANLLPNLEIHAEMSYAQHESRFVRQNENTVAIEKNGSSFVLGLRYLNQSNTTLIAEYYHNNNGFSQEEFSAVINYLDLNLQTSEPDRIAAARSSLPVLFPARTVMRDYFYAKLSKPEPLGWLYSSVSLFTIYNLTDDSFLLSPQIGYKPFTNSEFLLWPTFFFGDENSEYGAKQFQNKIELWLRFYF
ncbi:MAG: hypothetical protein DWQ05_13370 [Calditrichaeota bacterium]|nr:MAG: hypothetical protein DWQ05_13370 [Calditrichota bacterium]